MNQRREPILVHNAGMVVYLSLISTHRHSSSRFPSEQDWADAMMKIAACKSHHDFGLGKPLPHARSTADPATDGANGLSMETVRPIAGFSRELPVNLLLAPGADTRQFQ